MASCSQVFGARSQKFKAVCCCSSAKTLPVRASEISVPLISSPLARLWSSKWEQLGYYTLRDGDIKLWNTPLYPYSVWTGSSQICNLNTKCVWWRQGSWSSASDHIWLRFKRCFQVTVHSQRANSIITFSICRNLEILQTYLPEVKLRYCRFSCNDEVLLTARDTKHSRRIQYIHQNPDLNKRIG